MVTRREYRLLLAALLAIAAVGSGCKKPGNSPDGVRTGPPFAEAFPDPTALVTAPDIAGTREILSEVRLPDTRDHHDKLLSMLRSLESIDIEHLLLLTEAVNLGSGATGLVSDDDEIMVQINGETTYFAFEESRGSGKFADVVDQLLLEGVPKVGSIDRFDAGRILGRTQSDETLGALADALLPDVDDGSGEALREMLQGFGRSKARVPFVVKILAPRGSLLGDREEIALLAMTFDEDRQALLSTLIDQMDEVPLDRLGDYLVRMSFDEGRVAVVRAAAPKVPRVDGGSLAEVVRRLAFDEGREIVVKALVAANKVHIAFEDLPRVLQRFAFDDGRVESIDALAPFVEGNADAIRAGAVVRCFAFDSGRLSAIRALAATLKAMPEADRRQLTMNLSGTDREKAAAALGLE